MPRKKITPETFFSRTCLKHSNLIVSKGWNPFLTCNYVQTPKAQSVKNEMLEEEGISTNENPDGRSMFRKMLNIADY